MTSAIMKTLIGSVVTAAASDVKFDSWWWWKMPDNPRPIRIGTVVLPIEEIALHLTRKAAYPKNLHQKKVIRLAQQGQHC